MDKQQLEALDRDQMLVDTIEIVDKLTQRQDNAWRMITAINLVISRLAGLLGKSNQRVAELEARLAAVEAKLNQ